MAEDKYKCGKNCERFALLYETSNDAIMTLEPPDWKFTSGNPATVKMFKAKDEKGFVSAAPWQLSPEKQPDGRLSSEKAKEMIEKAMREGKNYFEWTHKRLDGEVFPATVLLSRLTVGEKTFLQATVRDISERDGIEKELKKSKEFFKAAAETTSDLIYEWPFNSNVINWFGDIDSKLGYEKGEFPRTLKGWLEQIHPDDQQKLHDVVERQNKSGEDIEIDYRIKAKDGSWRYWVDSAKVLYDDDKGEPVRQVGVCIDITEKKMAEDALKESEVKFKNIVEHTRDLFYIHDTDNILKYVSPQCNKIFGYTQEEMMVNWTTLITYNEINKKGIDITMEAINTGKTQPKYNLELKRKDGGLILVEIDEAPLKDKTGKVIGIVGVLRDITEKIKADEELKKRNKELELINEVSVGRELKMVELKKKVKKLENELNDK